MIRLIRCAFRRWLGHQKNAVQGGAQTSYSLDVSDKMRDYDAINDNAFSRKICNLSRNFNGNFANASNQPIERGAFKINEGSIGACNGRYAAGCTRDVFYDLSSLGFVGHNDIPWLWEARKRCWLPATESSYSDAYAILRNGAPVPSTDLRQSGCR